MCIDMLTRVQVGDHVDVRGQPVKMVSFLPSFPLLFYHVGAGIEFRVPGLAAGTFDPPSHFVSPLFLLFFFLNLETGPH